MLTVLEAALAFSLTMLVVATTVTQIVNVLLDRSHTREIGFRKMLDRFVAQELRPTVDRKLVLLRARASRGVDALSADVAARIDARRRSLSAELARLESDVEQAIQKVRLADPTDPLTSDEARVLKELTEDAAVEATGDVAEALDQLLVGLADPEELKTMSSLATEELLERLRRSRWGTRMLVELPEVAEDVFEDLADRWESLGEQVTWVFRANARRTAGWVALVLAFVVNIDSVHLIRTYLVDTELRTAVVEQADALGTDPSTLADDGATDLERAQARLEVLQTAGFPIGPDNFPHVCLFTTDEDRARAARCSERLDLHLGARWALYRRGESIGEAPAAVVDVSSLVAWILGILLTSMLAGLGGPFWYDLLDRIGSLVAQAKTTRKQTRGSNPQGSDQGQGNPSG